MRTSDATMTWRVRAAAKRAIDMLVAFILLVLALPMIVLAALGSAVVFRAWPFFTQERVGLGGRAFRFVKIRTLPKWTNPYTDKYHIDTRSLPAFARLLRHLHLDELPQLFLVLAGKMSLVGPRPEMAVLHEQMPAEFAEARTSRRPGCTGLWQISVDASKLIGEAPEYDLFYVDNHNIRLDAWILARTLRVMVLGDREIAIADVPRWALPAPSAAMVSSSAVSRSVDDLALTAVD